MLSQSFPEKARSRQSWRHAKQQTNARMNCHCRISGGEVTATMTQASAPLPLSPREELAAQVAARQEAEEDRGCRRDHGQQQVEGVEIHAAPGVRRRT